MLEAMDQSNSLKASKRICQYPFSLDRALALKIKFFKH